MVLQSWEDNVVELKLFLPKEFNFNENVNYLARNSNECLFHIQNNRISKAIQIGEETLIIEVSSVEDNYLNIRFLEESKPTTTTIRAEVARYVREWFDLDRDLRPFYALAKEDPLLGPAVDSFYGLRIIGIPDLFEALCWGILGQQINLSFAYTLKRRLVEKFGRSIIHDGVTYWVFPSPKDIATLSPSELESLRMTKKKSEYLIGVAGLMVQGTLTKELLLNEGSHQQAEKTLVKIRGIGPWTANYVLMRCLRYPCAFPIDDVGLHNAIKLRIGKELKPTKDEIMELAVNWTNWESYATFYLWRFLY
ncbi:DNA-3-methyladenine glycosylase 2 family protein [Bacillus sp. EB106-08-02-XG196]|jgi:DNA-3-methyladenine glycosylase II|uniref:DNA-3-methyladenine glycosylase 2 n=1 Tax=Bacillus sp. EB106-08-02-XG196 TaxID=2737049 RepID=UPI0015C48386|nr:DNA-3-methyladenine glycosylase [Bacillus sp. EB106-08-02-XG196]NWQ43817.1 DNA-3-methyladenine glycosylase 2 family protein [Bacillus sp. EB106-08-02-XG196]